MSIDMVNNIYDAMTVDPIDDDLFSFMDHTVNGKTQSIHRQKRLTWFGP